MYRFGNYFRNISRYIPSERHLISKEYGVCPSISRANITFIREAGLEGIPEHIIMSLVSCL
ncbi:hypothetical protein NPIL_324651, partial [Nephila pilipes]